MRLVDTAGIRAALDEAESIGVRKSMEALADADIVLVVLDVSEFADGDFTPDWELLEKTQDRPRIVVCNKSDLMTGDRGEVVRKLSVAFFEAIRHDLTEPAQKALEGTSSITVSVPPTVFTSALTGEGIEPLRELILRRAHGDGGAEQESGLLTNIRQQKLVDDAIAALDRAAQAVPLRTPHEMVLLDLYSALRPLDDITGATMADDILNLIFSSFCIGKIERLPVPFNEM